MMAIGMTRVVHLALLFLVAGCSGCARSDLANVGIAPGPAPDLDWNSANCRIVTLESQVTAVPVPGAILLIFDRSGSMMEPWNEQPRWQVAGTAITHALAAQPSTLTVGAVFFPSEAGTCIDPTGIACTVVPGLTDGTGLCNVEPIDAADQIDFLPSPAFLAAFNGDPAEGTRPRYTPILGGMTPLNEALLVAQAALRDPVSSGVATVVIITDGEPNCDWDQAGATAIVAGWRDAGIRTYVVGLPGIRSDTRTILSELAATGGTNMYSTPGDADAIEQRFGEILVQNVSVGFDSCLLDLDPPARMPNDFHVVVGERGEERSVPRVDDAGKRAWSVAPDGSAIELTGSTCAAAMSGAFTSIRFEFDCAAD